jgi:predicted small integral membrane protein
MIELRVAKVVMVASLAVFAFLVTFGNITDYDSNFEFVRHILSMDTTFPGNALMYRSITAPALWHAGYWLIILGEGLTCVAFTMGAVTLAMRLSQPGPLFNQGKRWVAIGATLGFLVWCTGFLVVGGEWFAMWQSHEWNGQEAAFRFYMTILAVLIFVNQPDE